jgi:tetratricopeptide (TPR) repeat protein
VESDDDLAVGGRIRALRQLRGLSQEDLAGPELSASYLSRIESGARRATDRVLGDLAQRLQTTVEHLRTGVDPLRATNFEHSLQRAELALRRGEPEEARGLFADALADAPDGAQSAAHQRGLLGLGQAYESAGDLESALKQFHAVTATAPIGSKTWVDAALGLVRCYRQVGDLAKSIDEGEQLLARQRSAGDWPSPDSVRLLATLQASYQSRGDYHYASRLAREGVDTAAGLGDRRALASALWNTSLLNAELGATADAVATGERALGLMAELDAERDLVRLQVALARCYSLDGQPQRALEALDDLAPRAQQLGIAAELSYAALERARALHGLGLLSQAEQAVGVALSSTGDHPRAHNAEIHILAGVIARDGGHPKRATEHLRTAAQQLTGSENSRAAAQSWTMLAEELDALGDTAGARDAYRAATANLGLSAAARRPQRATAPR